MSTDSIDLVAVRAFLYYSPPLREPYSGDGRVVDSSSGKAGMLEYFALNLPLADLGHHVLIDITLPPDILGCCWR